MLFQVVSNSQTYQKLIRIGFILLDASSSQVAHILLGNESYICSNPKFLMTRLLVRNPDLWTWTSKEAANKRVTVAEESVPWFREFLAAN